MAKKTPLFERHVSLGAKMAEFAGWDMPIFYKSIIDEHNAARNSCALFDIGHMGQIETDSLAAIQRLCTNDASAITEGQAQYSLMCNEEGGIIDDLMIYRLKNKYLVIANAVNVEIILNRFKLTDSNAKLFYENRTALALQGPQSAKIMQKYLNFDISSLKHRECKETNIKDISCVLSRTGYTGEYGFEVFFEKINANILWDLFVHDGVIPAGLGCRDTLRIEAGLPLYGHELDINTTPFEAGLSWAVKKEILLDKKDKLSKKLIGFEAQDKIVPRAGCKIFADSQEIGYVTSGTFSPTLKKPIGMGYIWAKMLTAYSLPLTAKILIRDKFYPIKIVKLPFYSRNRR